ncbi:MAG TPA: UbiA family prenyltransferase [Puia sp.]|nr:UbiA family prenyltransferase [Puia sp.]
MVDQTYRLLLHAQPSFVLLCFVFFATICSYNFHWYLTPQSVTSSQRIQWTQNHKGLHLIFYFIGLTGSAVCFFMIKEHWMAMAFAAFVTFLYSAPKLPQNFFKALKEVAIGKTIFLAVVWTYVTTVLPVLVEGRNWTMEYSLFVCSRFFLIYAICIPFDYRDREDDKQAGIRSMITFFDDRGINFIFIFSLLLFAISTILLFLYHYSVYTIIILLVPGILIALLYNYSKRNFSDYLYYFVLDGLMMLSALLMLIFGI